MYLALTRARKQVIVLGRTKFLEDEYHWGLFIKYCQNNYRSYYAIDLEIMHRWAFATPIEGLEIRHRRDPIRTIKKPKNGIADDFIDEDKPQQKDVIYELL